MESGRLMEGGRLMGGRLIEVGRYFIAELHSQGTTDFFLIPLKNPFSNQATQKIRAKFSYPKKSQNQKFRTQKNPSIIPVT